MMNDIRRIVLNHNSKHENNGYIITQDPEGFEDFIPDGATSFEAMVSMQTNSVSMQYTKDEVTVFHFYLPSESYYRKSLGYDAGKINIFKSNENIKGYKTIYWLPGISRPIRFNH